MTSIKKLAEPQVSMFGEQLTVERTSRIELSSAYGLSALRDVQVTTDGGTIEAVDGEIKLATSATADGKATLRSARRGRYVPGYSGEAGIGIRVPVEPTGNQLATWGIIDPTGNEGLYFGHDASGMFVARVTNGVETRINRDDWNIDRADGAGASFFNMDIATGFIYQIRFSWYGQGQIQWGVAGRSGRNQTFIPLHEEVFEGLSVRTPNLPIHVSVDNGGDTNNLDVYVGGRSYSIIGKYEPKFRYAGQERASVATGATSVPLITFRNKTGFEDRSLKIDGFSVLPVSEPHVIELRLNGTLTGASYATPTNYSAGETATEVDREATAISGGEVIYSALVEAGTRGNSEFTGLIGIDLDIPQGQPISLCARTVIGTGSIVSHFRLTEEW